MMALSLRIRTSDSIIDYKIDLTNREHALIVVLVMAQVDKTRKIIKELKGTSVDDIFHRDLSEQLALLDKLKTAELYS